ncbi:MAG: adenylosuccinate lyase, partial [Candidatus Melainabacteria bacterium]|nr:adenylosuccinate lyase [Candidatus Melainabacteria bacterium]
MPHKRNPVGCENICGLARILRANTIAALENIPLWHERDISHSSVERIILPDSTCALDFMLNRFNNIMTNLVVYPENMQRNMDVFGGVVFSQSVLLKLVAHGFSRDAAYRIVQANAMESWNRTGGNFKASLLKDENVLQVLSPSEIEDCFNPAHYLKNIDQVFERLGI